MTNFLELDHGIRCDRHVGEVFPPKCGDCLREALDADEASAPVRFAQTFTECPNHRGWPEPCQRCTGEA